MALTTCRDFEEDMAPELALGTLSGERRAQALEHVTACARCRGLVEELSQASDALLLVAPEAEPPLGFESRVLARVRPASDRRRRHRVVAALAGVTLLAGGAAASLTAALGGGAPQVAVPAKASPAAPGPAGGAYAREADLVSSDHRQIGRVFAYPGRPSWIFMTVDDSGVSGPVVCEVTTTDGRRLSVGTFRVAGGHATWGAPVQVGPGQMRSASIVTETGLTLATGSL